jgi:SAM-dependent MidA family methyltransferase
VGITLTEPRLETYLAEAGITLQPSQQAEINLRAVDLMEAIASWLGSGFVLTIDYGGPAEKVYALHRKKGTIRGYYRQLPVDDPMLHPGEQDLTSDVDFSALIRAGDRHALTTLGLLPQGQFLVNLGIQDLEKEAAKGIKSELEADYATSGIRKLYHPAAMGGGFQVLLQAKGVTVTPDRIAGLGGAPIPRRAGIWNPFRRAR